MKILLDVREPGEIEIFGTVDNSINIPTSEISKSIGSEKLNKDDRYELFCASGVRADAMSRFLSKHGFDAVSIGMFRSGEILPAKLTDKDVELSNLFFNKASETQN
jgi:rhodanese-related sulfurtransferase